MIFSLDDEILQRWFVEYFPAPPWKEEVISTVGSNPYSESELDNFIKAVGEMEVYYVDSETEILIVGREDWEYKKEVFEELLDSREGKQLKIYSQEMFLAYWITGQDPFEDVEVALSFAEGHPALEHFRALPRVDWINTTISLTNNSGKLKIKKPAIGVLKHAGYVVGKNKGLSPDERQKILRKVFISQLYEILSEEYVRDCKKNYPYYLDEWGAAKSERRLVKMRDFIASGCRTRKRAGHNEAASDYEDDLEWLRLNFHKGHFKFDWENYQID